MQMNYAWSMPNKYTFDIKPIKEFVNKYVIHAKCIIDPFAANKKLATYTNDLNPNTTADYHLTATEFLQILVDKGIKCDLCLFDPPYSPRQIKEVYNGIGLEVTQKDTQMTTGWTECRNLINQLMVENGVVLSFGWNSVGMGKMRNYVKQEILLVCHGTAHNDTICLAERKC